MEVLDQSAVRESPTLQPLDPFDVGFVEDLLSGMKLNTFSRDDFDVPEHLLPYAPQAVQEYCDIYY